MITRKLLRAQWDVTLHEASDGTFIVTSSMGEEAFDCSTLAARRYRLRAWHKDVKYWAGFAELNLDASSRTASRFLSSIRHIRTPRDIKHVT